VFHKRSKVLAGQIKVSSFLFNWILDIYNCTYIMYIHYSFLDGELK
jgi:hypothetical protein